MQGKLIPERNPRSSNPRTGGSRHLRTLMGLLPQMGLFLGHLPQGPVGPLGPHSSSLLTQLSGLYKNMV